ncbi:MAG: amino acid permease [Oxalobacteraceae bacterium]|nr:amino acid permease [Oxalobacteraceae bacterium]
MEDLASLPFTATQSGLGITLFALLGLESAAISARTVNNPQRTVPRATITGLAIAGAISVLVTCIVAFMMPVGEIAASSAPMADFIGRFMGSGVGMIIAIFGMVSCFGTLNGLLLVGGELTAAMAATGGLPKRAAQRSARGAPVIGSVRSFSPQSRFIARGSSRRRGAPFVSQSVMPGVGGQIL